MTKKKTNSCINPPGVVQNVPVRLIDDSGRHRKDLGDLEALAHSISDLKLLQPVVLVRLKPTGRFRLVAGERRLKAVSEHLGWTEVPAYVVEDDKLSSAAALLRAERDENTCRKPFTPSEAVSVARSLEALEAEAARARQREGGKKAGRGRPLAPGNLPEANGEERGQTRDKVAAAVGMSGRTYQKAKAVVEAAERDPAVFGDLKGQMDETGNVDGAAREMKRRQKAAERKAGEVRLPKNLRGEGSVADVLALRARFNLEADDALAYLNRMEYVPDSKRFMLYSPFYWIARQIEGVPVLSRDEWVTQQADVIQAGLRVAYSVCCVCDGPTKDGSWTPLPHRLATELDNRGVNLWHDDAYVRVGVPGNGGPYRLKNNFEFVIHATRGGPPIWSDNTAMGWEPLYPEGGEPCFRTQDGSRVNRPKVTGGLHSHLKIEVPDPQAVRNPNERETSEVGDQRLFARSFNHRAENSHARNEHGVFPINLCHATPTLMGERLAKRGLQSPFH
jgi:ParB family chromosome partitioning protein